MPAQESGTRAERDFEHSQVDSLTPRRLSALAAPTGAP